MLMEAADFASRGISRCRISHEKSIYSWVLVAALTYPYLVDVLGTGKTAKSFEYQKTAQILGRIIITEL